MLPKTFAEHLLSILNRSCLSPTTSEWISQFWFTVKGYVANVRYEGKAVYPDPPPKSKAHKRGKKVYKRKVKNPHMKFKVIY